MVTKEMITWILPLNDPQAGLQLAGGKGASLARLAQAGLPVPDGFIVAASAYRQFIEDNNLHPAILAALQSVDLAQPASLEQASQQIQDLLLAAPVPAPMAQAIESAYLALETGEQPAVAVRSSATAEDLPEASFAGQLDTYLNLRGPQAVLDGVRRCWASLWTARAIAYRARQNGPQLSTGDEPLSSGAAMAVVVQRLIPAESAGILFTANPLNGRRDQVMINAAWGLGQAIVGGETTPDTLIVDKASAQVLERQIADKRLMTVRLAEGGTQEQPVPANLRRAPVLDDQAAAELTRLGLQIEALYERPMDIEWAFTDGQFAILQARPITALSEPPAQPPQDWPLPAPKGRYLRNNIVELMPNPLSPLFATLGLRVVNQRLGLVMDRFLGHPDLHPEQLILTVNGYAYYNGNFTPGQMGRLMLGSPGIMRRMFSGMLERWLEARAGYTQTVKDWQQVDPAQLSAAQLMDGATQLLASAIDYYSAIVSGMIPAAWMTEAIFTQVYQRLIQRAGDPQPAVFLLGFDSQPLQAEKALFDLAAWARADPHLSAYLLDTPTPQLSARLDAQEAPAELDPSAWRAWRQRFNAYRQQYGGTIYDLDFLQPTPAGQPEPLLETFKLFLRGQGSDPYTRQAVAVQRRESATQAVLSRLGRLRRPLFVKQLERAQKYAPLRETGLAEIGLGYPLLRRLLLELGRRLVIHGAIDEAGDIFWLTEDEARQMATALDLDQPLDDHTGEVRRRQNLWQARKSVVPPVMLPQRERFLGVKLESFNLARDNAPTADAIEGTPCSAGVVTGPARVLTGPQDFDQMQPGDVLVAAITTPAWTPLFAMASAIVTDIGGPLSHGSIVAREYGIPAVLGTGVATRRIHSGQTITVDGAKGKVYLEQPPER